MKIIGVLLILVVLGFYGAWLYWMRHRHAMQAKETGGWQEFNVLVKGVYSPAVLEAKIGQPVRINFLRQESTDCSRFVNFPDFKIRRELPENQNVTVEIKPEKKGQFVFTCDMSMYQGKLIIN